LVLDLKTDTIELDIFKVWKFDSVLFDNPKASISIQNSIGIPIGASLETFDAKTTKDRVVIPIEHQNALGETFKINYPNLDGLEGYNNSTYELNGENSNLQNVIKVCPQMILYKFNLVRSHKVNTDDIGEIIDTSRLVINTEVLIPFLLLYLLSDNLISLFLPKAVVPISLVDPKSEVRIIVPKAVRSIIFRFGLNIVLRTT